MVVLPVLTGVLALLGGQLSPDVIWVWKAVTQDQLQIETGMILSQAAIYDIFLCMSVLHHV